MRVMFLGFCLSFFSFTASAQLQYAPTNCPIGTWVAIVNDENQSPKKDVATALEVINQARNVLRISNKVTEADGSILYHLTRIKDPTTDRERALEARTIHAIFGSFKALTGVAFYCYK